MSYVGQLRARLGLDSAEFSAGLRNARAEATGFNAALAQGMRGVSRLALGAAGVTTAVAGGAMAVRSVMRDIATIGDEAQRAGLSVEAFQEWSYVAAQARIPIDALTDGFKELALRADEFIVTGSGAAAEAFQRLGFGADDLARRLEDPGELFVEIARRMQHLESSARIRIADELFGGTGGERFVALLNRGAAGISAMRDRARDLGLVMDEEVIERATEIDQRFAEVIARLDQLGKSLVVNLVSFVDEVLSAGDRVEENFRNRRDRMIGGDAGAAIDAAGVAAETRAEVEALMGAYNRLALEALTAGRRLDGFSEILDRAGDEQSAAFFETLAQRLSDAADAFVRGETDGQDFISLLDSIGQEGDAAVKALEGVNELDMTRAQSAIDALRGYVAGLRTEATAAADEIERLTMTAARQVESFWDTEEPRFSTLGQLAPRSSPRPRRAPAMLGEPDPGSSGGSGGGSAGYAASVAEIRAQTAELLAQADALMQVASSGVDYGDAVEYARIRAELLSAAQAEGRTITDALRAEIDDLAAAQVTAQGSVDQLTDALERQREAGQRGAEALTDVFMAALQGGDAARNAVSRLILEMARMAAMRGFQSLLSTSGGGGLLGLFGGLLGKNARGTASWIGGATVVGEEGPEILNLPTGARITPALATAQALRGAVGGGTSVVRIELSPDVEGRVVSQARGMVVEMARAQDRALPDRLAQIQANPRRR